jgi:peptidylprolyl isomerase
LPRSSRAARSARVAPALLALAALALGGCRRGDQPEKPPPPPDFAPSLSVDLGKMKKHPDELYVQTLQPGTGDKAKAGDTIWMTYTGWLPDGSQFDSNEGQRPLLVTLGKTFLIDGFMEGIVGIQLGEERRLVVPPTLGYGKPGDPGVIPRNSWLVFKVRRVAAPEGPAPTPPAAP